MIDPLRPAGRGRASVAGRRVAFTMLAALALAACGGDRAARTDGAESAGTGAAPSAASPQPAGSSAPRPAEAPTAGPGAAQDPLAEARDSLQEAELYHRRQQSMESLESCLGKARVLDQPARGQVEAACRRSHGG